MSALSMGQQARRACHRSARSARTAIWRHRGRALACAGILLATAAAGGQEHPTAGAGLPFVAELGEVPHLDRRGQLAFRDYADALSPKAFAISVTGAWGWWGEAVSREVAREEALRLCHQTSSVDCALFALDSKVVWGKAAEPSSLGARLPRDSQGRPLPPIDRRGQERFKDYLGRPDYKAFAVGSDGVWDWWFGAWSREQAEQQALSRCGRHSAAPCELFATGNEVVWRNKAGESLTTLGELPVNADTFTEQGLRTGSYVDQETCSELPDRVWVTVDGAGFCIRYFAAGLERLDGEALAFLHGDVHGIRLADTQGFFLSQPRPRSYYGSSPEKRQRYLEELERRSGLEHPLFAIGRPGAFGSSGHHGRISRTSGEWRIIDAVLNKLARRYGIERWSLAGQSGGSNLIAMLMGARRDLSCVALGSGGMGIEHGSPAVTDPMSLARRLRPIPDLRIFLLGDPLDSIAPIEQQRAYHRTLTDAGVSARFIEFEAKDPFHHGLGNRAIQVADMCASGFSDDELLRRLSTLPDGGNAPQDPVPADN